MDTICKLCGYVFDENDLEESIESHLQEKHYLRYQDYYEIVTLGTPYIECWKCGAPRYVISPYLSDSHLPCFCCVNLENKQNIQEIKSDFQNKIRELQGKLLKSRYYQYFISSSQFQKGRFLPKDIEVQSKLLLLLKQKIGGRIDKSSIFKVTNPLGRSSEISERNLEALEMEISELRVTEVIPGKWEIGDTGFYVRLPEIIPFDPKHHSRGSILNRSAKRTARKLRFSESGECIKFWNVPNLSARTILFLSNSQDSSVSYQDLSEEMKWKIRFGILKTKPILSRIFEIYNELLKYVIYIEDSVFLQNSLEVPFSQGNQGFKLVWGWEEYPWEPEDGSVIKLSII